MVKPKPQMTAVAHAVSDQVPLEPTVGPARKKRPTVSDVKSLQDQLSISQVSGAKQISLLRQQLAAQSQAFTTKRNEMRKFMTDMMKRQRGELVEETVRSEPLPVIDMVDDASVTSEFSYLTGDSEGHSTVALSNVQVVMAPDSSTNVPQPTTLARMDAEGHCDRGSCYTGTPSCAHCHNTTTSGTGTYRLLCDTTDYGRQGRTNGTTGNSGSPYDT